MCAETIGEKIQSLRRGGLKTAIYVSVLASLLVLLNYVFGWKSPEDIPRILQPYGAFILAVQPHLVYLQAIVVLAFGYLIVNAASGIMYSYVRKIADRPTATVVRTVTKIAGGAVLLSTLTSIFDVNPAAALTVGSFGGLVAGFATQTILSHVVAGVFLLISGPFRHGDTITVSGQTGIVKEIRLMHLVLETEDGTNEILIPSGSVVTQIIRRRTKTLKGEKKEET